MTRRKLLIALVTAGLYALLTAVASAELHRVQVTLVTGQVLTVTVDVPPGTPVSEIKIPDLPAAVQSISDLGPVETPTPTSTPSAPSTPTPSAPSTPTPSAPSTPTPSAPTPDGDGSYRPSPSPAAGANGGGATNGGRSSPAPVKTPRAGGTPKPPKTGDHTVETNPESLIGQVERGKTPDPKNPTVNTDGSPSLENPTFSLAQPGPARIGVPNFFIEKFRIPPFLLPIYQAAGIQYGVRWEVLAAINEIETDYGRNLNVSSAGAVGWMQFMPGTWKLYGVDANKDGYKDPNNPADAIFAAARYLRAAGAQKDLHKAIFSYNHAEWYVDSVLLRARVIGGLPADLVGSLTGLTQGRFPVLAEATYASSVSKKQLRKQGKKAPAYEIRSNARRNGIKIFARQGAPVVAVNDGKVVRIGRSKRLGRFVTIQDVYGNVYTYGRLKKVARVYPSPKPTKVSERDIRRELNLDQMSKDRRPTAPASKTTEATAQARKNAEKVAKRATTARAKDDGKRQAAAARREKVAKQRLFANPARPAAREAGGAQQIFESTGRIEGYSSFKDYLERVFGLDRKDVALKKLRPGAQVTAGTILGRIGRTTSSQAPHVLFEVRPAGRGAPRIDPKPILDGWKLLESTAIYRAAGKNPFFGPDAKNPSIGQILLMSKETLSSRVLSDPRIQLYDCGRHDVRTGQIDRRVLATLEFLSASGFKPTVTSLKCGHSFLTTSGNVSEHTTGTAVDIAAVNGIPIIGNQGKGSITDLVIQRLLTLQGTMKPHQIISLMTFHGTDNTFAMADHDDHIHVGWRPLYGANSKLSKQVDRVLRPSQWIKLIDRLSDIDNPVVREQPSKYAVKSVERASDSHRGE
jgi:Transglycosylase SLT domain/Peptidase family M23